MSKRLTWSIIIAAVLPAAAQATEVQFEGSYRMRMSMFDTLSLDHQISNSEGLSWYTQHRLWLRPKFLINDKVRVISDIKGLDNVIWGDQPAGTDNPLDNAPWVFEHDLTAPTSATDETAPLADFTLWRAWGEVDTQIGSFKFGRVPLHWGSGIWLNDGLTTAPHLADYGDTTDRIQWSYLIQDQFWLQAAVDVPSEGLINDKDDTTAFNAAVAYRSESVVAGLNTQLMTTPAREFNLFTIDGAVEAELGKLQLNSEWVGQFGGGDLENGLNQVSITALGGVLDAELDLNPWTAGVTAGLATGDGDDTDARLKTFTFDRDFSVGMMMFEQPMPVLAATAASDTNAGRDFDAALSGNAISNALFLRPKISREIVDGLSLNVSWLAARAAKVPERFGTRRGYGQEFDLGVNYSIPHFDTGFTFGTFLPGTFYKDYADDTYENFDDPVFGGQLFGRIRF